MHIKICKIETGELNDLIIQAKGLTKKYRRYEKEEGLAGSLKSLFKRKYVNKIAVNNLDLEIKEGEFIGLIGPNGAGKTTLVKLFTGIIAKTSGELQVLGRNPNKLEKELTKQYSIVMGQKSQLFFELTARDTFLLFKKMYNIPDDVYNKNVEYLVNLFEVQEFVDVQVRTLSLGERMKMELIVNLLQDPKILFLDEPTIGLDVVAQRKIREFLKEVNKNKGTTIILTSHYMEDIQQLCKRCIVINKGIKLYDGSTDELFNQYNNHKIVTIMLENESTYRMKESVDMMECTPFKIKFRVAKEYLKSIMCEIVDHYDIADISVENDDIGNLVERIYSIDLIDAE